MEPGTRADPDNKDAVRARIRLDRERSQSQRKKDAASDKEKEKDKDKADAEKWSDGQDFAYEYVQVSQVSAPAIGLLRSPSFDNRKNACQTLLQDMSLILQSREGREDM